MKRLYSVLIALLLSVSLAQTTADRDITHLVPEFRVKLEAFIAAVEEAEWRVQVVETCRSDERERELQASGASHVDHSWHQDCLAADIVIVHPDHGHLVADWQTQHYVLMYRDVDPRQFDLTSGCHLWDGWDAGHIQGVELQGAGTVCNDQANGGT